MINDRGMRPALGLSSFARIVDQEGIDQRHRADRRVGAAGCGNAQILARQPFQVAVLAHVNRRVRAELAFQPAIHGQVVVRWSKIGIVVDRDRIFPESARRLHQDHHIAGLQGGCTISPSGLLLRSTNSSPGASPQAAVTAATRSAGIPRATGGRSVPRSGPAGRRAARL